MVSVRYNINSISNGLIHGADIGFSGVDENQDCPNLQLQYEYIIVLALEDAHVDFDS